MQRAEIDRRAHHNAVHQSEKLYDSSENRRHRDDGAHVPLYEPSLKLSQIALSRGSKLRQFGFESSEVALGGSAQLGQFGLGGSAQLGQFGLSGSTQLRQIGSQLGQVGLGGSPQLVEIAFGSQVALAAGGQHR